MSGVSELAAALRAAGLTIPAEARTLAHLTIAVKVNPPRGGGRPPALELSATRAEGDVWKGPSGRWFTKRSGRVVPTKPPGAAQSPPTAAAPARPAPAEPPAPQPEPAGDSFARAFAQRGSARYRAATAEHERARQELARAEAAMSDPGVPYAAARDRLVAARVTERLAASSAGRHGRFDLLAHLEPGGGNVIPMDERSGTRWTAAERDQMTEAVQFLAAALSRSHGPVRGVKMDRSRDGRPYYFGGTVHVTRSDDAGTYLHEVGHHLEKVLPGARAKAVAFWRRRTAGEEPVRLRARFPGQGFAPDEEGRADDFGKLFPDDPAKAHYVGKVYTDARGEVTDTEVLSMGLELLYRDPKRFAAADPEYFDLMISVLQPERKGL